MTPQEIVDDLRIGAPQPRSLKQNSAFRNRCERAIEKIEALIEERTAALRAENTRLVEALERRQAAETMAKE